MNAAGHVIAFLDRDDRNDGLADALSEIKGLFSRVGRQDQWDWFVTSRALGHPAARTTIAVANALASARRALLRGDEDALHRDRHVLRSLPCRLSLGVLVGTAQIAPENGSGWIYLLSTREMPDLLKVGMTTRTVEERVREINGATGVAIPFGVRRCWRTREPAWAERLIHQALGEHRFRADREFFRASFREAAAIIDATLADHDLELHLFNERDGGTP